MREDYRGLAPCIFEETCMVATMLYLRDCPGSSARKIDLYRAVSSNPRMPDKLGVLEGRGLITQVMMRDIGRSTKITLTPKGVRVANLLADIEKEMEEDE